MSQPETTKRIVLTVEHFATFPFRHFVCLDEEDNQHSVDFPVGDSKAIANPKQLVGKTVSCSHLEPLLELGMDMKIEEADPDAPAT